MTQRGIELELPDLPEVPLRLGAPLGRRSPAAARAPGAAPARGHRHVAAADHDGACSRWAPGGS
jgi:hypothetical protein